MSLILTLFFNAPRGPSGPTQDPELKWLCLSLCNYLTLHRLHNLPGCAGGHRKGNYIHSSSHWTGMYQTKLASSGVRKAEGQSCVSIETVELRVWADLLMKAVRKGGGNGGEMKTPYTQATLHLRPNASVKFHHCPHLQGEDHKPHTESLTSQWEFVHWATPSAGGPGDSRSSRVYQPTPPFAVLILPCGRICKPEPCKEREQAAQFSLIGPASDLEDTMPGFHSLAFWAGTPAHMHSELCCSQNGALTILTYNPWFAGFWGLMSNWLSQ